MEELELTPEVPAAPEDRVKSEVKTATEEGQTQADGAPDDIEPQTAIEESPAQADSAPDDFEPQSLEPELAVAAGESAESSESDSATETGDASLTPEEPVPFPVFISDSHLQAILEAVVYVAEEPLTLTQISTALAQAPERVEALLRQLMAEFEKPEHGIGIREVAGGFKMATKAEHHDTVRGFVRSLKPSLKLSLPALETLAVIAYKQPVTAPEIMDIRGVQGTGVLKTLLDRKLIASGGRKNVIGKPILYKTTKEFLIQFGLKDIAELPSIKEFEEIRRMAFADSEPAPAEAAVAAPPPTPPGPGEAAPAAETETPAEPAPEPEAQ